MTEASGEVTASDSAGSKIEGQTVEEGGRLQSCSKSPARRQ